MTEQPTDWIKDAGWIDSLYRLGQEGSRPEFDALLRRLLYEHGASLAAVPAAEAGLRAAVEGLAEEYTECWVTRSSDVQCLLFIGGEFGNGEWTEQMCCLPCRLRSLLAGRGDVG